MFQSATDFSITNSTFYANYNYIFLSDEERKLQEWLAAPDCSINFMTALNKKIPGTGRWILEHSAFIQWVTHPGILWIQGRAGSGKTILTTTILEYLGHEFPKMVYFHYFDLRDNTGTQSSYRGFLLSLVQQMGSHMHKIHPALQNLYEISRRGLLIAQPSNKELEGTLKNIIEDLILSRPCRGPPFRRSVLRRSALIVISSYCSFSLHISFRSSLSLLSFTLPCRYYSYSS
ncbi:hypothetical protein F5051DRAFT_412200 [Lentinula edodes]|nr:hypothetical protein F5051DRAFT_412200 [Lentinula edodes]